MSGKTVRFVYENANDYRVVYANGAQGGLSPQGEMIVNFFVEKPANPFDERRPLAEDGSVGEPIPESATITEYQIVRSISTSVVMSLDCARRVKTWLENILNALDKQAGAKNG